MKFSAVVLGALVTSFSLSISTQAEAACVSNEMFFTDGDYTVTNVGAVENPWTFGSSAWFTNGTEFQGVPTRSELKSPLFEVPADGNLSVWFTHRYSFEFDNVTRWDGGQLRASINGGSFEPVTSFSDNGYDGTITGNNFLNGQPGFNGNSPGYPSGFVTSVASLGGFSAGDTVTLLFIGAWDEFVKGSQPNWEITDVTIASNLGECQAPVPATNTFSSLLLIMFAALGAAFYLRRRTVQL